MINRNGSIKAFALLNLMLFLTAIGDVFFFNPLDIAAGGLYGLALVILGILKITANKSSLVGLIVIILNIPLLIYSYFYFEKEYFNKSVFATLALPAYEIGIEQFLKLYSYTVEAQDLYLSVAVGTIIQSVGIAFVMYLGGSTGGLDIIARIINKYIRWISIGMGITIFSLIILYFQYLTFGLEKAIATILAIVLTGYLVDFLLIMVFKVDINEESI